MLTNPQKLSFEKLRGKGSSPQDLGLSEEHIKFVIARSALDLQISTVRVPSTLLEVSSGEVRADYIFPGQFDSLAEYEKLLTAEPDAETYAACLGRILRARLKYQCVLETQSLPTMDQVGPRSLLQYGTVDDSSLASLLVWRKWVYDIDNRAAQDTGYLFEPILAGAIGGVPYSHRNSPIRRLSGTGGRQVDAIKDKDAFEFKIRITIAASGQGRWKEELDFPEECENAGYRPVLIVLDPTPNTKLSEISDVYRGHGGVVHTGEEAWDYLRAEAGAVMGTFITKYVEAPIKAMVDQEQLGYDLLPLTLSQKQGKIVFDIGDSVIRVDRKVNQEESPYDELPDDAGRFLPGGI